VTTRSRSSRSVTTTNRIRPARVSPSLEKTFLAVDDLTLQIERAVLDYLLGFLS
jgi:hypothetical protein